jgi:CRISPR-associated protein Cas2
MAEAKNWYVICYDITEPKRWRRVYKKLKGYGRRLQYSIFRCRLTVGTARGNYGKPQGIL